MARLADMDAAGIDIQVLSYGGFPQLLSAAQAIDPNRAANDKLARTVQAHPARFAGFATLPWRAPEAAARELERAVKEQGLKSALINGRPEASPYRARWLACDEALVSAHANAYP